MKCAFGLLVNKPEAELQLLRLLTNKLGDPFPEDGVEPHLLLEVTGDTSDDEIDRGERGGTVHVSTRRPTLKAQYYGAVLLNQIRSRTKAMGRNSPSSWWRRISVCFTELKLAKSRDTPLRIIVPKKITTTTIIIIIITTTTTIARSGDHSSRIQRVSALMSRSPNSGRFRDLGIFEDGSFYVRLLRNICKRAKVQSTCSRRSSWFECDF